MADCFHARCKPLPACVLPDGRVIPAEIRTARRQHACSEFGCTVPIRPGEKYEHAVYPPNRIEAYDYANEHWQTWRNHWPRTGPEGQYGWGCDLAEAYAENERRRHALIDAALAGTCLELECPGCNADDPEDFRNGCEIPWHVEALAAMGAQAAPAGRETADA